MSSPNPLFAVGTPVTFAATVTPVSGGATPTGIVTFMDSATAIGSSALNGGGVATLVTSTLTIAVHTIRAVYGGDGNYQSSAAADLYQVISVNPACVGNSATNAVLVEHYYTSILHRPSDPGGKASWINEADRLCALDADTKRAFLVMASVFFNSSEYVSLSRGDNDLVMDLYSALFNRLPDAGGWSYWLGQLAGGIPRDNVTSSFVFSPEFMETMNAAFLGQTARAETYAVLDVYGGLGRRLADTGGYTAWIEQFRNAQCGNLPAIAVRGVFGGLSSFLSGAPTTNSQYVVALYYGLLQRGAEPVGYNYWVGQLDGGFLSREQVRQRFLASPEMEAQSDVIAAQGCLR